MLRLLRPDRVDVLVHRVSSARIPVFGHPLHRRQNLDKLTQLLRHHRSPSFTNVPVQAQRLILRQDVHMSQIGVDAVGQRDGDDAVLTGKGHSRLGPVARQREKSFAGTTSEQNAERVSHDALPQSIAPDAAQPNTSGYWISAKRRSKSGV